MKKNTLYVSIFASKVAHLALKHHPAPPTNLAWGEVYQVTLTRSTRDITPAVSKIKQGPPGEDVLEAGLPRAALSPPCQQRLQPCQGGGLQVRWFAITMSFLKFDFDFDFDQIEPEGPACFGRALYFAKQ